MNERNDRRAFLTMAGAGVLLAACRKEERESTSAPSGSASADPSAAKSEPPKEDKGDDVSATEDLMREHGVIRRVLVAYREVSTALRIKPAAVDPGALQQAAELIRGFGEDYHEKQLEEMHIFPALIKAGSLTSTVNTLIAQHQRGREATEYILSVTRNAITPATAGPLALTLDAFARMYEEHTAIEDTIVFPAWKKVLTPKELDEMGDRFEDIEHKTFGKDGFDDAVEKIAAIEKALGIELAALTAPPVP